ncbi:Piezo non-specific cation channel, R-Ras-binding domain [Dillenia turbinata]|uniref:Piezo non-specific cation channel, R-Ras-binding domain n=1 Tax=Dillenia turbinata TaxID=194707 RepID=A0AAN8UI32_9MAGN
MTKFCNRICLFFILMCHLGSYAVEIFHFHIIVAHLVEAALAFICPSARGSMKHLFPDLRSSFQQMYSSDNPTNIANPIKDAKVRIDLKTVSGRLTLFKSTLCEKISWDVLDGHVRLDPQGYLSAYNEQDIQLICCQADASTLWAVPRVVHARFISKERPKGKEAVNYEQTVQDKDAPKPSQVMQVLNDYTYARVSLVCGDFVLNSGNPEWWSFHDINASEVNGCGGLLGPMAIIVSEETPPVGRFIRLQCSDLRLRIPNENLPSCDRLLAICEDIYAARAEGELEVEEVLYWTLVKIYRSPHMLLEYTEQD